MYLIVISATLFETFRLNFPDSITDRARVFQTFSSASGLNMIPISAVEGIMAIALGVIILRRIADRKTPFAGGVLLYPLMAYMGMVVLGAIYGIGTGSAIDVVLWEVRSQTYLAFGYLIVVNTIHSKVQLNRIMWVFIIAVFIKGLQGSWRLMITLGGDLDTLGSNTLRNTNSLLSHDESLFFTMLFGFFLILFLFRSHKNQLIIMALTMPPTLLAFLANQRRAGMLMVAAAVLMTLFLTYKVNKDRRKLILSFAVFIALIMPGYVAATWSAEGFIAEPTRALRSVIAPDNRDSSSNDYRVEENINLKINIQMSPVTGRGFGHSIIFFIPLEFIGTEFEFWDITPHNTVLWVWMRMGYVGFVAFWFLLGIVIVKGVMLTRMLSDMYLKSIAILIVATTMSWIAIGLLDMGFVEPRLIAMMSILFGLIAVLPQMQKEENERIEQEALDAALPKTKFIHGK